LQNCIVMMVIKYKKKWQSFLFTILLVIAIFSGMFSVIQPVSALNICYAANAAELNAALSNPACDVVKLTADIVGHAGTVVNNPASSDNKVIDGQNHTISGTGSGYGIYFSGKTGIEIRFCNISNFVRGMHLYNCDYFNIHHNSVHGQLAPHGEQAIYFRTGSKYNIVHNNTLYNNYWDGVRFGFYTVPDDDCEYNEVYDNVIYKCSREGIDFAPGAHYCIAKRNYLEQCDWCINLGDNSGPANNIIIEDNTMRLITWIGSTQMGICIFRSCDNVTITNNSIINITKVHYTPSTTKGIYLGHDAGVMPTNIFMLNNIICGCDYDIYLKNIGTSINGTSNICSITYNYNDSGATGCNFDCSYSSITNFVYEPLHPTDMQTISFTDTSRYKDGTIVSWSWSFGDGNASAVKNPTHQYADDGIYTVTLNVTYNDGGTNETSKQINVSNVPPVGDFIYAPVTPVRFEQIAFNTTATDLDGHVVNWTWDFEDGNYSYTQNATHPYSSFRSYNVTLTIKDNDDAITMITKTLIMKNFTTNITNAGTDTTINLLETFDIIVILNTTQSTMVNISQYSGNPTGKNISGDITAIGKYIDIEVENESTIIWPINITIYYTQDDLNTFNLNESQLLGIYFWNDAVDEWQLYNDTGVNTIYNQSGYEGYCLVNAWHLTNLTLGGDDESPSKVTGLTITDAKDEKLSLSWDEATDNAEVDHYKIYRDNDFLVNKTTTSYQDTGLTNEQSYAYRVSAVDVSGNEGIKSDSKSGIPSIADANGPYHGSIDIPITLDGSESNDSDGNITLYEWDFGDDTNGTGELVDHAYAAEGIYTVTLTVTNDGGKTGTDITYSTIREKPNRPPYRPLLYGTIIGYKNTGYNYTVQSTDLDNDSLRYVFDWGDGTNTTTDFMPKGTAYSKIHNWVTPGIYTIEVYAEDKYNAASANRTLIISIDAFYCGAMGYLIDNNSDGTYDTFYCYATGNITIVQQDDGTYLIDTDGDGSVDYTFNPSTAEMVTFKKEEQTGTPGFEIMLALCAIALVLFWKRKKQI